MAIDESKIPSPMPGVSLDEFKKGFVDAREEIKTWSDQKKTFIHDALIEDTVRSVWKSGGIPAIMAMGVAIANSINKYLRDVMAEQGVDFNKAASDFLNGPENDQSTPVDKSKMN